jgi:hypothetical protein
MHGGEVGASRLRKGISKWADRQRLTARTRYGFRPRRATSRDEFGTLDACDPSPKRLDSPCEERSGERRRVRKSIASTQIAASRRAHHRVVNGGGSNALRRRHRGIETLDLPGEVNAMTKRIEAAPRRRGVTRPPRRCGRSGQSEA